MIPLCLNTTQHSTQNQTKAKTKKFTLAITTEQYYSIGTSWYRIQTSPDPIAVGKTIFTPPTAVHTNTIRQIGYGTDGCTIKKIGN